MQLNNHSNTMTTNIGEHVAHNFGIGDASAIIGILRDKIYSHPIRTLTQEYISNGRDSNREAGLPDHSMDITIPNALHPIFKVRDYGVGISPDRIANVFVLYGASTKRANNVQTGGFGIGAKSAWSYTDSFNVITYVDGVKRFYVAHVGTSNSGRLDLLETSPTTEPNGTEIQIGVKIKDCQEFKDAVYRAIYFWNVKPNIKGDLNTPPSPELITVSDTIFSMQKNLIPSFIGIPYQYYGSNAILINDGIPYEISPSILEKCPTLKNLLKLFKSTMLVYVPTGTVETGANRETLAESPCTVNALELLAAEQRTVFASWVKVQFDAIKDNKTFIDTYIKLNKYFHIDEYSKFGDYTIQNGNLYSDKFKRIKYISYTNRGRQGKVTIKASDSRNIVGFGFEVLKSLFYVDNTETPIVRNKRIRTYFEDRSNGTSLFTIERVDPKDDISDILTDLDIKDLKTLTYVVMPKKVRVKGVTPVRELFLHTFKNGYRDTVNTTTKDNTQNYIYVEMDGNSLVKPVCDLVELDYFVQSLGYRVCGVSGKYLKNLDSKFIKLDDWLKAYLPTDNDIVYAMCRFAKNTSFIDDIKNAKGLQDLFLTKMIKKYEFITNPSLKKSLPDMIFSLVKDHKSVLEFVAENKTLTERATNMYPLVKEVYSASRCLDEIVIYMNAKYNNVLAKEKEGK